MQHSSAGPGKQGPKSSLALSISDPHLTSLSIIHVTLAWCPQSSLRIKKCNPLRCWGKVPRSVGEMIVHQ